MPRVRLTARGVDQLATEKRREEFWDTITPGLILRVSRTGHKTWYVRYRANGTRRRHKLGAYGRLSLAQAREAAREVMGKADAGEDPAREREEQRDGEHTFEALAREVLAARALRTRESTQYERERMLERELLDEWGTRPAAAISRRDVVQLVEAVARRGTPVAANRTLALIHLIFNDGIRRGFPGIEQNPAHLVEKPGREEGRDRYLTPSEIGAVWAATEDETPATRGGFRLALLTGQRIGSVLRMRWDGIKGDLWTIPEEAFMGERVHLVPLSPQALDVLEDLRFRRPDGAEYVFPSREGSKKPYVGNLSSTALPRVREATGLPHWTIHDFRTTFRTHAVRSPRDPHHPGLGIPAHVADAVLGHKEASLGFARYTGDRERYLLAEKREALASWGEFVGEAVEQGGRRVR